MGEAPEGAVAELVAVMRRLRAECPWKQEQTHRSLVRYLLEETYETVDAIDAGELSGDWSHLAEELGDVLLQVVFHAAIAEERGEFDLDDVARGITAKMRRRNPHVFGAAEGGADADAGTEGLSAAEVDALWQRMKAAEKPGAMASPLPSGLPALLYADKALARRERAGSALPDAGPGIGERLLALVAEARAAGVDPEEALRDVVRGLD
ncbi:MazG nucleotide pyrophosphohydrolase domain-containing protein [Pimelobacter simplex]|uniref:MazG nucleotide pyrophosphohydrolase domain-containing protein n=1 Tax=Nocardioides simplex TaxID=2045 RepID=UPI00214FC63B|nr:MazG nucleotide pyrophosphohydrolase domain-containing protein [Pimelobacter simplex]UUW92429.1 nucleoside triphosphate pyrophosphohydrolase [Pimelobacter simplex]UUW96257.1 nucleoside triphosphate pyrophosphohydrolase [Pimelobacter simplex]